MITAAVTTQALPMAADPASRWARWACAIYLWLGLPGMFLARLVLPVAGYSGLSIVGLVHLGLLATALTHAHRRQRHRDACLRAATVCLVLGPGIFFLGAATGSPNPLHAAGYAWNTVGVTIGSLLTTAGFVALAASLWSRGEQLVAALGVAGAILATTLWLPSLALRVAVLATDSGQAWADLERVYAHVRTSNAPMANLTDSWRGFMLVFTYALSTLAKVLLFLVSAVFAWAAGRRGLIGQGSARTSAVTGLGLAVLVTIGRACFGVSPVRIAWAIATIPFAAYLLPYVLGAAVALRAMPVGLRSGVQDGCSPRTSG